MSLRSGPRTHRNASFNGAAASQPRMSADRGPRRGRRPWRFNGAAASQPRMCSSPPPSGPDGGAASMGPRPRSRGCQPQPGGSKRAFTPLQWGRGLAAADVRKARCCCHSSAALQWGRGLAAADVGAVLAKAPPVAPLQWGRGLAAADVALRAPAEARLVAASMGPRPRSRGCSANASACSSAWKRLLQWGRGLAAADVLPPPPKKNGGSIASMGPRPRSRGCRPAPAPRHPLRESASMGPRPRSRGCVPSAGTTPCSSYWVLQWGRGLAAADVSNRWRPRCSR